MCVSEGARLSRLGPTPAGRSPTGRPRANAKPAWRQGGPVQCSTPTAREGARRPFGGGAPVQCWRVVRPRLGNSISRILRFSSLNNNISAKWAPKAQNRKKYYVSPHQGTFVRPINLNLDLNMAQEGAGASNENATFRRASDGFHAIRGNLNRLKRFLAF